MQRRWSTTRRSISALITAPLLALGGLSIAAASPAAAHNLAAAAAPAGQFTVAPNQVNMLDCNGWSAKYQPVVPRMRTLCVDPHGIPGKSMAVGCKHYNYGYSSYGRFVDNCHYVGHDEPSVKFISSASGSGNTMTYFMQLPTDPPTPPTNTGSVTKYAELTGAAWFGLPICDPASYPQKACTAHSDKNSGAFNNPKAAGSAFMELQFYAPGFTPFQDNTSCSVTKWCVAMNIDSLESQFNFVNLNPNCPEPVNFAYLQTNGIPAGPPSPQKANGHTFTPNSHTLKLNSGDIVKVAITDPLSGTSAGFTTTVTDMTTGQKGFMIASAHNGFMHTNYLNCNGSLFTFHAEYNTASQPNQVPWAALEGGVLMEQEIGHNEVCASLTNPDPTTGPGLSDPKTSDTCVGGSEGGTSTTGEGSCSTTTGVCQNPTTQGTTGPVACPSNNFTSGNLCEYADGTCIPQGSRTFTLNGVSTTAKMPINFCEANRFQNGDLDFDGISYQTTSWPNGTANTPTSFRYAGPFTSTSAAYPQIQFETDAPGSEFLCNTTTGVGCAVPPTGSSFYPYWTLTNKQGIGTLFPSNACIWNFGNTISGVTTQDFGKDSQYGSYNTARPFGTNISSVMSNPEVSGSCPVLH